MNSAFPPREEWGPGPWTDEPDRVEWRESGFPCLMTRGFVGQWCGYVAVTKGHPWYEVSPFEIEARAHGGLNWGSHCSGNICHVPEAGEADDVWWVGFDCGHAFDRKPALEAFMREQGGPQLPDVMLKMEVYRDVEYTRLQVTELAKQAAECIG